MVPGPWVKIKDKAEIEMNEEHLLEGADEEDAEGPQYTYYKSEKILGELFRAVEERKIWDKDIKWSGQGKDHDFWSRVTIELQAAAFRAGFGILDWRGKREEAQRIRLT